ncbi:transcriptional repressor [Calidifontibacter sp. DB0510]|uniref:Transcriptional repressor n=1 Tax=Metallococcus carri TaxID=1656884 RepID=A0A967B385_9MICO|nr:Fur family transcriptional regulator [Metallococcus carri]NHN56713.1 transcriptional repressor [Metallococcus carri]NOP37910.1 transcriptional repressor [Calidifontibacter sp. DB2511S]
MADERAVESAVAQLRAAGERVTPARRAVLEVLAAAEAHLDAERVAGQLEQVHRATVYRTLQSLAELGVISHTHVPDGGTIYHLRGREHAHAHLQCARCQAVVDIPVQWLDPLRARVERETGFLLAPDHAALLGVCADCRAREASMAQ